VDNLITIIKVRMVRLHMIILSLSQTLPPRFLGGLDGSESVTLHVTALFLLLPHPSATTPNNSDKDKCTTKRHQQNLPPL
jgi:hypothetical protein